MVRPCNQNEPVSRNLGNGKRWHLYGAFHKADIGSPFLRCPGYALRVSQCQAHIDQRKGGMKPRQKGRQPIAGDGLAGVNGEKAALAAAKLRQHALG